MATVLHNSPPKKEGRQSKALIKGMVGPYLALGHPGLSNGTSRSFRLKEKRLRESNSIFLPGVARMRFLEGLSSYVEVLDALQRLYPAQLALAQTEVNRRLVIIQLYKALGGGWNLTDAEFMTACCSHVVQSNQP